MKKNLNYYLIKLNRISGWILLVLIPILMITGYGIAGDYKWTSYIATAENHSKIHKFFIPITIIVFGIHSFINIYFSIKRWKKK